MKHLYRPSTYPYFKKLAGVGAVPRPADLGDRRYSGPCRSYANLIAAFDIETSRVEGLDHSAMYVWQLALGDDVIIGRTWAEWRSCLWRISSTLPKGLTLVLWVHNLSYEFNWLQDQYRYNEREVFATGPHEVLRCTQYGGRFEWRCSYQLTNMSLGQMCKRYGAKHQKLDGDDYNYTETRYPWTPLGYRELRYCIHDVLGLVESIRALLAEEGDTYYSLPSTATGFVRREVKRAMHDRRKSAVLPAVMTYNEYLLMRWTFRGGNTHASRFWSGQILSGVQSWDRSSSYPDVICNAQFPMAKFEELPASLSELDRAIYKAHRPILAHLRLVGVRLKDRYYPIPYLARAKCQGLQRVVCDNGRILEADVLEVGVTDVDLRIIRDQYEIDRTDVLELHASRYGRLPKEITQLVRQYYRDKTKYKGATEPAELTIYRRAKERINSVYGMMVMDPLRQKYVYSGELTLKESEDPEADLVKQNKRAFLLYAWGVWVTAWARWELEQAISTLHSQGACVVYCDTDSVKFFGPGNLSAINDRLRERSEESGSWADDRHGERHYMGVWEPDGEYLRFKTLGAKKYVVEESDGLHVTIAGVGKRKGAAELQAAGGIEAFDEGFVFSQAGGVEAVYNGTEEVAELGGQVIREGHKLQITRNLCLLPSTYTVGITGEYAHILQMSAAQIDDLMLFAQKCRYERKS